MYIPKEITHIAQNQNIGKSEIGRIISEHRERYILCTTDGELQAEITGNLRNSAQSGKDFPAVGDWVQIAKVNQGFGIITSIFPRKSILERKSIGNNAETQVLAANIDMAFIISAVGYDFNFNRLERFIAISNAAHIKTILILSKIDLISQQETDDLISEIKERLPDIHVFFLSNISGMGLKEIENIMKPNETYCFLGSSGVGKSSLINSLLEDELIKTSEISTSTSKGKHTTSSRNLFVLPNGSMVIDTPGMREIGITASTKAINYTFSEISEMAQNCKFSNCTHINEPGCKVIEALTSGELPDTQYQNFLKLRREQEFLSETIFERRQKNKQLGKLYKRILKNKNKLK